MNETPKCPFGYSDSKVTPLPAVKSSDLTYNDYLKIPELLNLQAPQSDPAHHDEMLFIIIHQAYELWFKLVLHEMRQAQRQMDSGDPLQAQHFLRRIGEIMKLMVSQIHILETMTPQDFLEFRDRLMPASGFQSVQFRELEYLAGLKDPAYLIYFQNRPDYREHLERRIQERDLRQCYYELLRKKGYPIPQEIDQIEKQFATEGLRSEDLEEKTELAFEALLPIYRDRARHLPVFLLTEALIDFDQQLCLWREHHVRVVERIIGSKRGTGGSSGVEYLQSTTQKRCFPLLWQVRGRLEKFSK